MDLLAQVFDFVRSVLTLFNYDESRVEHNTLGNVEVQIFAILSYNCHRQATTIRDCEGRCGLSGTVDEEFNVLRL